MFPSSVLEGCKILMEEKRNTAKGKKKENKGFPYKKLNIRGKKAGLLITAIIILAIFLAGLYVGYVVLR